MSENSLERQYLIPGVCGPLRTDTKQQACTVDNGRISLTSYVADISVIALGLAFFNLIWPVMTASVALSTQKPRRNTYSQRS